jgi:hypothetical protein
LGARGRGFAAAPSEPEAAPGDRDEQLAGLQAQSERIEHALAAIRERIAGLEARQDRS